MADSGLAFLDVVSCSFGAVILLLIITKSVAPEDTRASAKSLAGDAATLQAAVLSAQGRRDELREATAAAKAIEALKQGSPPSERRKPPWKPKRAAPLTPSRTPKGKGAPSPTPASLSQKLSSAFWGRITGPAMIWWEGFPLIASTSSSSSIPPAACLITPGI